MRAWTFKPLEVNFFSAYLFQEYQEKSSAINEVNIDLLSKKVAFFHKKRVRALMLRFLQNQKMHVLYCIKTQKSPLTGVFLGRFFWAGFYANPDPS